jgi:hypothetical protein
MRKLLLNRSLWMFVPAYGAAVGVLALHGLFDALSGTAAFMDTWRL